MAANNNNLIHVIHHVHVPLCGEQMIAKIMSFGSLGGELLIMLGWALFYLHGLWDDETRELIQNIADKKSGFERKCYPWRSDDPLLKARWYPARVYLKWQQIVLNQVFDHFLDTCFMNSNYKIIKTNDKGLQVMCNNNRQPTLNNVFGPKNPGILIPLSKSFKNALVRMGFDSIYEVSKDVNNTVKDESFALLGIQCLLSHDHFTQARLMHIEDSGRSLLIEWQGEHFQHYSPGAPMGQDHESDMTTWTPLKVNQQTLPDCRLTPEEIADGRGHINRYFESDYEYAPQVVRYWTRFLTRGTFIKDLTNKGFKFNEEFVIKYADNDVMGRNPNYIIR